MTPLMEHRGYVGTAELSEADGVFHGKLAYLRDLVTYESETATGLVRAFREAVDDYLADCGVEGREPDRPFKGQFQVRTRPELHRAYARLAAKRGVSLNEVIADALERALGGESGRASFTERTTAKEASSRARASARPGGSKGPAR